MGISVMLFLCFLTLVAGQYTDDNIINVNFPNSPKSKFEIYWNIPTQVCIKNTNFFRNLSPDFGIFQNENDKFRGDVISLLYEPGLFPTAVDHAGKPNFQNFGLPQLGNLTLHEVALKRTITNLIPDENFQGLAVIDFESWRPVLQQNWGALKENKRLSYVYECDQGHQECDEQFRDILKSESFSEAKLTELLSKPDYKKLESEASSNFEKYARLFMERTMEVAKSLRPKAKWGYYAYPYCYNMNNNQKHSDCPEFVKEQNNRVNEWLFSKSDAFYPSVYISKDKFQMTQEDKKDLVRNRIKEAVRIRNQNQGKQRVYAYVWYKYNDNKSDLTKEDLELTLKESQAAGADGVIIWGSSADLNNEQKCKQFEDHFSKTLGPVLNNFLRN